MQNIRLHAPGARGIVFSGRSDALCPERFFGFPCVTGTPVPDCSGSFYLSTERGRYEGARFRQTQLDVSPDSLRAVLETADGAYRVETRWQCSPTGVISRTDTLTNCTDAPSTVHACLPRLTLQDTGFALYAQASNWSMENQGAWLPLGVGDVVLSNANGRSTENAAPFACLRQTATGLGCAIHIRPVGDWIIRVRRAVEGRATYLVLETGLSDRDLHMAVAPGETLELPEVLFVGFEGAVERCAGRFQRYLLERYPGRMLPEMVYNTWFFNFDVLEPERLREQVLRAKALGCRTFVVDAGWFGRGADWEHQVGCWEECAVRAFGGRMKDFADFVRAQGLGFGLWMEPERACAGTPVCRAHPDWFLDEDTVVYDLCNPAVRAYLCGELTRLVRTYGLCWMKLDFNSTMYRDRTGSNYYRYFRAEEQLMQMIRAENPACTFEGCASGGMRADFHNAMHIYHGFFASDTAHPIECLRIRQGAGLRMLPAYTGAWLVMHETPFPVNEYFTRGAETRTKLLAAADPWWDRAVDLTADLAVKLNLMGEWGLSGDLSGWSEATVQTVARGAAFYEAHRAFLSRSVCHLLTAVQRVHDVTGWTAVQYENIDGAGSLVFVFRMACDAQDFTVFPQNLDPARTYHILCDGAELGVFSGAELLAEGIPVHCSKRFAGKILSIL